MINKVRDFYNTLEEELKYRNQIESHQKGLEATLWGLEEQCQFPENTGKDDQVELSSQINNCRLKQINCKKLIDKHDVKMVHLFEKFSKEMLTNPHTYTPEGTK